MTSTNMLKIALIACLLLLVKAQHTHNEHDTFTFFYDDPSSTLVMTTPTHCYLMMLTDAEKTNIMTDIQNHQHNHLKLEALELQMAALVSDDSKHSAVDPSVVTNGITTHCQHLPMVKVMA